MWLLQGPVLLVTAKFLACWFFPLCWWRQYVSPTSVLTKATQRHIPEDIILQGRACYTGCIMDIKKQRQKMQFCLISDKFREIFMTKSSSESLIMLQCTYYSWKQQTAHWHSLTTIFLPCLNDQMFTVKQLSYKHHKHCHMLMQCLGMGFGIIGLKVYDL
jgi:hypothetical protein